VKLYWFWSFNPQKVRLALHELDLAYDLVAVDLFRGQQRHADFVRLNPHAKVPVLEDGAMVVTESNAILAYLGEREQRLWPADAAGKALALSWLFLEARHLSECVGNLWFNDFVAPQANVPVSEPDRARAAEEIATPLALVESQLASSPFITGANFSLVDCCYAPLFDALSLSNFDLAPFPNITAYLTRVRLRPSWQNCDFRSA
jgi:glutathione S-transferase